MALFQTGESGFGAADAFRRWMDEPAYGLGNQIPFNLLHTLGGIDDVAVYTPVYQ
ncbi:antitoxin Xre/MbcA/ParS toxin-binding domain-containing protein [Spirosoma areae]